MAKKKQTTKKKKVQGPFIPTKYVYIWKWCKYPKEPDYYLLHTTADTPKGCEDKMIEFNGCRQVWKWKRTGEGKVALMVITEAE